MKKILLLTILTLTQFTMGQGTWTSAPSPWNVLPIHTILLPNKKLLTMNRSRVGDNQEGEFYMELIDEPYTSPGVIFAPYTPAGKRELFCAGHTLDENGNVVIAGGHGLAGVAGDGHGIPDVWMYKWETNQLVQCKNMREGRWYPSVVQMPDRTMMFVMGSDCYHPNCPGGDCPGCQIVPNTIPELWTLTSNSDYVKTLPDRAMNLFYPVVVMRPSDGRAFFAATGIPGSGQDHNQPSGLFNPATLSWDNSYGQVPPSLRNCRRYYPSSVMVDGVLYRSGGSVWYGETNIQDNRGVRNTVKFDFNTGVWSQLPDMNFERLQHTMVALPDARIVSMGGGFYGPTAGGIECAQPEILDTENQLLGWTLLSPPSTDRVGRSYHSIGLLLPDARVLFAGGERLGNISWAAQKTAQFYTPQYGGNPNWQSIRPNLSNVPSEIRYGEGFNVHVDTSVSKFRLISLGAVTHAYNENQQFVTLTFTSNGNGNYTVNSPINTFKATPGYYMLFAIDANRIPSVASIVKLKDFERIFSDKVIASKGVAEIRGHTSKKEDLILGDNSYYSVSSSSNQVKLNIRSELTKLDIVTKIRLTIEARSSVGTISTWYLKNRVTGLYEVIWSGTNSNVDKIDVVNLMNNNYVQNDGRLDAQLIWQNSSPFSVFVDRVEFGVR